MRYEFLSGFDFFQHFQEFRLSASAAICIRNQRLYTLGIFFHVVFTFMCVCHLLDMHICDCGVYLTPFVFRGIIRSRNFIIMRIHDSFPGLLFAPGDYRVSGGVYHFLKIYTHTIKYLKLKEYMGSMEMFRSNNLLALLILYYIIGV